MGQLASGQINVLSVKWQHKDQEMDQGRKEGGQKEDKEKQSMLMKITSS